MKTRVDLTENSIPKSIMAMTFPMMVGMVSIFAFNLIDTFFIAKLGTTPLAAMSFTLPIVMLQGAISMGLGVGASAVISQAIGKKDSNLVKRLTTDSLFLSVSLVILIVILGILTIKPLFTALGATGTHLELINEYMFIWYLGVPFVVIPMVGNNAIRATGNSFVPSMIMVLGVVINIILDPLLIFGIWIFPEWGLKGAALATVIARAISFVVSLYFLHFKFNMLTARIESISHIINSWRKVLYIAIPAALTQLLPPLSMAFLTKLISTYGEDAIAALGVANRIEMFALSPLMALGAVLVPFAGQNLGAKKIDRIMAGISFSNVFSMAVGIVIFMTFLVFHEHLALLFVDNSNVVTIVGHYLIIVSIGFGFRGIAGISSSTFSALNKPISAASVNLIRLFIFYIPLTLLGSKLWGLNGIFSAIALAATLSGLISMTWIRRSVKKIEII